MKFWKYHVNGNDFILLHTKQKLHESQIQLWCKQHFGIGADGILQVWIEKGILHYRHFNADGSPANMCGNGIRCVGYWYMNKAHVDICKVEIANTQYRIRRYKHLVTLEMPVPEHIKDNLYRCGVMHKVSDQYEESSLYNVNVVKYQDPMHFHITTYELGVGKTYSCGTGNLATFYHGYKTGKLHKIAIGMNEGGKNLLQYSNHFIYISAPVHAVMKGSILLE